MTTHTEFHAIPIISMEKKNIRPNIRISGWISESNFYSYKYLKIIKRDSKFQEAFSLPKILNINPRSIYNKIIQLKTYIKEKNIDAVFVSESWERQEDPLTNILDIDGFQVISNPYQRKGIGGKPALIINTKKFNVINPNQSMISIPWGVEIVWAIITPKQVSNSSKIKR